MQFDSNGNNQSPRHSRVRLNTGELKKSARIEDGDLEGLEVHESRLRYYVEHLALHFAGTALFYGAVAGGGLLLAAFGFR
jgi:hypothetical protein